MLLLVVGYAAAALVWLPGAAASLGELVGNRLPLVMSIAGGTPLLGAILVWRVRAGGSAATGWKNGIALAVHDGWLTSRIISYTLVVVFLPVFFWAFAAWKTHIPPFTADRGLAAFDRVLHGTDPYRLFASLQTPRITAALDDLYNIWRYVLFGLVVWRGWFGTALERARFWLAFVLTWIILGSLLARLLPSAGPAYFWAVTGEWGPYDALMTHLHSLRSGELRDLFTDQRYIWDAVMRGQVVLGSGVSAFPSLHVALPVLGACATWQCSRVIAIGFVAYAALVWLGSFMLGWHYAVDGYASMLLVPVIWSLSGRLATRG